MRKLYYLFGLIALLKNWPAVLVRFLLKARGEGEFRFRSGLVVCYSQWIEVEEIIGTFIRQDYGEVRPRAVVIDVGASLGSFSLMSARKGARVLAFEPAPESFVLLAKNIELNQMGNRICPLQLGVAGRSGRRDFFLTSFSPLSSFFGRGVKTKVGCVTLADIFRQHRLKAIDLLKLDCEGAEYEILYRTPAEILQKIKEIRLEYHVLPARGEARLGQPGKRTNPEDLTEFLLRQGFALVHQRRDAPISGILWFRRLQS
ncbi:MAG: FkbM family methyltransferase [Patescibacteria group bacterium]